MYKEGADQANAHDPQEHGLGEDRIQQLPQELAVVVDRLGAEEHLPVADHVEDDEADEHDAVDVLAGAALGMASSMYLTKSYQDDQLHIATNLSPDYYGLSVHYNF